MNSAESKVGRGPLFSFDFRRWTTGRSCEETPHLSLSENSITAGAQARSRPLEVCVYTMSSDGSDGYLVKVSVAAKRLL